jgi:hypothetical protein
MAAEGTTLQARISVERMRMEHAMHLEGRHGGDGAHDNEPIAPGNSKSGANSANSSALEPLFDWGRWGYSGHPLEVQFSTCWRQVPPPPIGS